MVRRVMEVAPRGWAGGYLEIWDGVLAVVLIGQQTLKLFIRFLAARQVASICCGTPCIHNTNEPVRNTAKMIARCATDRLNVFASWKCVGRGCAV